MASAEEFEQALQRRLYRFDCPDAHTLGEYQLDLVDEASRTRIAAHAAECEECRLELQTLRAFLATPTPVGESLFASARRIVANLFTPQAGLAYGGLRGAHDARTRVYEAGDVTVSVAPGPTPNSLVGLVAISGHDPGFLEGRQVRLMPRQAKPIVGTLDDLSNFEFTDVPQGAYALEIALPDGVVVIEELRVG